MFGNVWRGAGQFRRSDKNMFDDVPQWVRIQSESSEEMAVRFHHRIVWVHPFPNGSGRHARLITDIFMENVLHGTPFAWGKRELSKPREYRARHINTLQEADSGNLIPLLEFAKA